MGAAESIHRLSVHRLKRIVWDYGGIVNANQPFLYRKESINMDLQQLLAKLREGFRKEDRKMIDEAYNELLKLGCGDMRVIANMIGAKK